VTWVRRFCRFWYDFVVGDDPIAALWVVAALVATWFAAHHGHNWYWLLPVVVIVVIAFSIRRYTVER
jgi:hypothetical protein